MRKGALMTGMMTDSSTPVDMRGTKLVPEMGSGGLCFSVQGRHACQHSGGRSLRVGLERDVLLPSLGRELAIRVRQNGAIPECGVGVSIGGPECFRAASAGNRGRSEEHTSEL